MSKNEEKKSGKGLKIFLYVVLAIFIILVIFVSVLYAYGNSNVDDMIPAVGVHVIDVPITAKSQEYFDVSWNVRGGDEKSYSGVYFSDTPSQVDFTKVPMPDSVRKVFVSGEAGDGKTTAHIPNLYPVTYIVIYANIKDQHYWSNEFIVSSK